MLYKNKKGILKILLFLVLCTVMFSTENNKKIGKTNSQEIMHYHELIHSKHSSLNNLKENNVEDDFKLEIESE